MKKLFFFLVLFHQLSSVAQANVWTEYMTNPAKIKYMILPRMPALSEVLRSRKEQRSWSDFENRLQLQFKRYELGKVTYSRAYFDPFNQ